MKKVGLSLFPSFNLFEYLLTEHETTERRVYFLSISCKPKDVIKSSCLTSGQGTPISLDNKISHFIIWR